MNDNVVVCKYCQSENVRKYGKYKDTQYYYCNGCKRKFSNPEAIPKMSQLKKHLNLTYTLSLAIALIPLILISFLYDSVVGYVIWIAVLFSASWWTLQQKGRSYSYLLLVCCVAGIGIPVILCLTNKTAQDEGDR